VLADDGSAAHVEGRREPTIDAKRLRAGSRADDIDDGVYRSDFVEMHVINGDGMNGGFGLAKQLKCADGALFDSSGEWAERMISRIVDRGDERRGCGHCVHEEQTRNALDENVPVSMFLMRVSRFNCLLVRSENVDLGGSKPAAADLAHLQARTDIERGCCFLKTSKRNARINEAPSSMSPLMPEKHSRYPIRIAL